MAEVTSIIDYYTDLLIIQYHDKPRARAHIALLVQELLAAGILFDIRDAFDLETAVGVQLDILGLYIGVSRFYKGQILEGFFAFTDYIEDPPDPLKIGFAEYSNFETKLGKYLQYNDLLSSDLVLNDDDYRFILKLKIVQNNSNHSHKSIDDSMFRFFGDTVYADSEGNMEMYYFVPAGRSAIVEVAIQKQVLPRPMGVMLNYVVVQESPFFGFATYDGFSLLIAGFSDYTDFDTKVGEVLTYDKLIEA